MKILVTGHQGFIGQNMIHALNGHDLAFYEWGDTLPVVDRFDWVVHLGAISSTTETDVEKVMRQNFDFSCWLLNECNEAGVDFQYSSSASVYGLNTDFREDAAKNPLSPYAWSKYLFDRYVEQNKWQGIRVQGFRYFNVYGPHEDHKGNQSSPHHKFTKQAKETGVIKLFINSEQYLRDFVPVEQVTDIHKQFFNVEKSGIWNLGTGEPVSFDYVARNIAAQYDARIEYIPMPDALRAQYQTYTCADLTKLKEALDEKDRS
jgi:ADP-L-glycero-D-manno-heptose 6-epimerase